MCLVKCFYSVIKCHAMLKYIFALKSIKSISVSNLLPSLFTWLLVMMKVVNLFNKNFFDTNIKYLQFALLWPPEENGLKRIIYLTTFGASFTGMVLTFMLGEMIELLSNISSYDQTIRTMSCFMFHLIYLYKIVSWFKDRNKAKLCIEMLYRKSYNFTVFEQLRYNFKQAFDEIQYFVDERFNSENIVVHTGNLEEFWRNYKLYSNKNDKQTGEKEVLIKDIQEEITSETNIHSCLVIIIVYLLVMIAIGFIYCDCIYQTILGTFYGNITRLPRLPEEIYFPVNTTDINTYTITCIYQTVVAVYVSTQYLGIDFFFWSMLIHLDGQVRVIQKALHALSTEQDVPHICQMDVQFSKCMHELQRTIDLLQVLKDMYSIPLLLQYLFVIVVSCCVLYSMSQEDNVLMAIGLVGFAGCALANSFFNLFYITELTHQFAAVPNAIYSVNWTGTNIRFQKQIIFALARIQKTIGIDMGGMISVDLNVFIKIMQTTYSFFTLLKTKET